MSKNKETNEKNLETKVEETEVKEETKEEKKEETKEEAKQESKENDLAKVVLALKEENAKLKNDFAKAYADTENTRKRLNNEALINKKYRIQSFALDILPAIDNLERALAQETSEECNGYKKGVEMIYNQIMNALDKEGVKEIEALNKDFDPNFHQAIMMEKVEGVESNKVVEVLQKGYVLKDRILRPSMVKVSE